MMQAGVGISALPPALTTNHPLKEDRLMAIEHSKPTNRNFLDITGMVFNRLKVLSFAESRGGKSFWNCICVCGNSCIVLGKTLRNNNTKSCGCLNIERRFDKSTTHGYTKMGEPREKRRLYRLWSQMKYRCANENIRNTKIMGGAELRFAKNGKSRLLDSLPISGQDRQAGIRSKGSTLTATTARVIVSGQPE
jgi:hypothetical protein